jgi:hypothetical protein
MIQSVETIPSPAVEVTPKPDAEALVGGVCLDLDGADFRSQGPQVTVSLKQLELRHPEEIAPRLWEKCHLLLKIPLRKVNRVEAYLNKPPLQAKERNCIAKGSNKACQDHDLTAQWKRAAKEKQCLTAQMLQLDPVPTQSPLGRAPDHPQKKEVGRWQ